MPEPVHRIDPGRTMTDTGPPPAATTEPPARTWEHEAVRTGGQLGRAGIDWLASGDRPRGSTLAVVTMTSNVILWLLVGGLVVAHQLGSSTAAEQRLEEQAARQEAMATEKAQRAQEQSAQQAERMLQQAQAEAERTALNEEIRALRLAILALVDEVAEHHSTAKRVGRQLERQRGSVRP